MTSSICGVVPPSCAKVSMRARKALPPSSKDSGGAAFIVEKSEIADLKCVGKREVDVQADRSDVDTGGILYPD